MCVCLCVLSMQHPDPAPTLLNSTLTDTPGQSTVRFTKALEGLDQDITIEFEAYDHKQMDDEQVSARYVILKRLFL